MAKDNINSFKFKLTAAAKGLNLVARDGSQISNFQDFEDKYLKPLYTTSPKWQDTDQSPYLGEKIIDTYIDELVEPEIGRLNSYIGTLDNQIDRNLKDIQACNEEASLAKENFDRDAKNITNNNQILRSEEKRAFEEVHEEYNHFKTTNKLHRRADTPKASELIIFLLFAVVVESSINCYFYLQANPMGLLGAILEAIIVSAINVALAWCFAQVARYVMHVKWELKIFGLLGSAVYFCILAGLSFLVGHVRQVIDLYAEKQLSGNYDDILTLATLNRESWESFASGPFHLAGFFTILLFIISVLTGLISFIKSIYFPDSYPGFFKVESKYRKQRDKWQRIVNVVQGRLENLKNDSIDKLNKNLQVSATLINETNSKIIEKQDRLERADRFIKDMKNLRLAAITAYRQNRGDNTPLDIVNDYDFSKVTSFTAFSENRNTLNDLSERFEGLRAEAENTKVSILNSFNEFESDISNKSKLD